MVKIKHTVHTPTRSKAAPEAKTSSHSASGHVAKATTTPTKSSSSVIANCIAQLTPLAPASSASKGRGRPKHEDKESVAIASCLKVLNSLVHDSPATPKAAGRGRPKKVQADSKPKAVKEGRVAKVAKSPKVKVAKAASSSSTSSSEKRGRGRPRKPDSEKQPPKAVVSGRGRGRPPKVKPAVTGTTASAHTDQEVVAETPSPSAVAHAPGNEEELAITQPLSTPDQPSRRRRGRPAAKVHAAPATTSEGDEEAATQPADSVIENVNSAVKASKGRGRPKTKKADPAPAEATEAAHDDATTTAITTAEHEDDGVVAVTTETTEQHDQHQAGESHDDQSQSTQAASQATTASVRHRGRPRIKQTPPTQFKPQDEE